MIHLPRNSTVFVLFINYYTKVQEDIYWPVSCSADCHCEKKQQTTHLLRDDEVTLNLVSKNVEWLLIQILGIIRYEVKITILVSIKK